MTASATSHLPGREDLLARLASALRREHVLFLLATGAVGLHFADDSLLDSYVSGFALQQLTLPFDTPGELAEAAESILRQFPADEYPHLAETITEHVTKPGYDYADEFKVGLDVILDGIERLQATGFSRVEER